MRVPKPRPQVQAEATSATVAWPGLPAVSYYSVRYRLYGAPDDAASFATSQCEASLSPLLPGSNYTVLVGACIGTQRSQEAVVHFKTDDVSLLPSLGSGSALFPPEGVHALGRAYAAAAVATGYAFCDSAPALYVDGRSYQFCTFRAGRLRGRTHADLRLAGTLGDWSLAAAPGRYLDDVVLQVRVQDDRAADGAADGAANQTGWLDANRLRVPGVLDVRDGGRVFDGVVGRDWATFRVTFSSVARTGDLYARVGLCAGRSLSGIVLVEDAPRE